MQTKLLKDNTMIPKKNQILNEYDYLVYITEQCIKKGFDFESYNSNLSDDECEIGKLQHFVLRIALIDADILNLVYAFEKEFWPTHVDNENSYRDLIDLHLDDNNIHVLNLN